MMKIIFKIFTLQFIFGFIFAAAFFLSYLLFESQLDLLIYLISVVISILIVILYLTIVRKLVQKDFISNKIAVFVFFILVTLVSTIFSLIDVDILNFIAIIFQQSYYFVSELIDETTSPVLVFALFFAENSIKFLILLFSCKKQKAVT